MRPTGQPRSKRSRPNPTPFEPFNKQVKRDAPTTMLPFGEGTEWKRLYEWVSIGGKIAHLVSAHGIPPQKRKTRRGGVSDGSVLGKAGGNRHGVPWSAQPGCAIQGVLMDKHDR
mmetsp:Transcript_22921/g.53113  ORF Transcript_22921/g.53113 Transcript_22921/m.53113 type:complete len:114 (-) Transcript_22921:844-1185(-)